MLVHEATHLWLQQSHVPCPDISMPNLPLDGLVVCDDDWASACGYEAGVVWLMALNHDWDLEGDEWDVIYWDAFSSALVTSGVLTIGDDMDSGQSPP